MKILVYGINYYPELTGIGKYTCEMCEWLAAQGHQIEVLTALPYYPEWRIHDNYRGKIWHSEEINGVKVYRTPFYVPGQVNGYTRLLHDFSFMISSFINWIKIISCSYDLIICIYPPLAIGFFPFFYKLIRNTPLVFHIQDLQVDAARQLGIIRRKSVLNMLETTEKYFFKHADLITTISEGMCNKVLSKGIDKDKIALFPNWVDTQQLVPRPQERIQLKMEYGYQPDDKVILYSGNLGEKQGLNIIIEAAYQLKRQQRNDIHFYIVGEGAVKKLLVNMKTELQLDNIRFGNLVPKKDLSNLLNMADLHLILQRKGASDLVMPSKLSGILSVGGVSLIAAEKDSTLYKEAKSHNTAIIVEPENSKIFLQAIIHFFESDLHTNLSRNARQYALNFCNKDHILSVFENKLFQLASPAIPQMIDSEPIAY